MKIINQDNVESKLNNVHTLVTIISYLVRPYNVSGTKTGHFLCFTFYYLRNILVQDCKREVKVNKKAK